MNLKHKKILITGADGFIGSHLAEILVKEGSQVKALSQYNSFNRWGWLEDLDCLDEIEVFTGDVRDPYFCNKITKDVDIIFHLAALIAIPYSYAAPASYVDTNIYGTLNICQAALGNGCLRVIHTSTSEVYGSAKYVPIDEKHTLQPQSPYSATKIGADAIALSYYHAYKLPLTIARPFNTYGPRQSARAIIPTIITQIASGRKEIKLGNLSTKRDLNYVLDTCGGFIALAKCEDTIGETVNIGSGHEISMADIVMLVKSNMQCETKVVTDEKRIRPESSEVDRLLCDNKKIKKLTGFTSQFTIEEGLDLTIRWFTNPVNLKKYKEEIYNV